MWKSIKRWWNGLFFGDKEIISFIEERGPFSFRTIKPALLEYDVYIHFSKLYYILCMSAKSGKLKETEVETRRTDKGVNTTFTEIFYSVEKESLAGNLSFLP